MSAPSWTFLPVAAVALAVGLVAGPAMPWADSPPGEDAPAVGFSRDMQVHHAQAVEMSILALDRASDAHVRAVALDILTTQQAQIGTMAGWLDDWGLPQRGTAEPMAWMADSDAHGDHHELEADGRMPGMASAEEMGRLRELQGLEFDRLYVQLMRAHHVGGLPMADAALDLAERDSVVVLARSMRQGQEAEIEILDGIAERLGAEVPEADDDPHAGHGDGGHGEAPG